MTLSGRSIRSIDGVSPVPVLVEAALPWYRSCPAFGLWFRRALPFRRPARRVPGELGAGTHRVELGRHGDGLGGQRWSHERLGRSHDGLERVVDGQCARARVEEVGAAVRTVTEAVVDEALGDRGATARRVQAHAEARQESPGPLGPCAGVVDDVV